MWPNDLPRRTMTQVRAFNRAAVGTALNGVELQLAAQRMGADLPKTSLEQYLLALEAFTLDSSGPADARESWSVEECRQTHEPESQRGQHATTPAPAAQRSPQPRRAADRSPPTASPDEQRVPRTVGAPPPTASDRSAERVDRGPYPADSRDREPHDAEPESPRAAPTGALPVGGDPRLEPERTAGPRPDDRGGPERPGYPSIDDRPGGETPLRGPDARADPARYQPPTSPEPISQGADRRESERAEGTPEDAHRAADTGRHADEPEADIAESETDELGIDNGRSTDEPAPDAERIEEIPIDLDRSDVSEARATEDRPADTPMGDERPEAEGAEDERTDDDRSIDDRPDEDETITDEETPDESSGLLSRFFGR